jgi:hypothetical protein
MKARCLPMRSGSSTEPTMSRPRLIKYVLRRTPTPSRPLTSYILGDGLLLLSDNSGNGKVVTGCAVAPDARRELRTDTSYHQPLALQIRVQLR